MDENEAIDEAWLTELGWVAIGNTWYPPESSHPRKYEGPILFWVRVDGTLRIAGSAWESGNDATRSQLRKLCEALNIYT